MDIPFEQFGRKLKIEPPACPGTALDWRGLQARLTAAHATRRILAAQAVYRSAPSGSFAPAWAPQVRTHLAAGHQSDRSLRDDINQIDQSIGKPLGAIEKDSNGNDPLNARGL